MANNYNKRCADRKPKKVLITGFGPFADVATNPSWEVVKKFDGNRCGPFRVMAAQLPVEYDEVDRFFSNMVAERNDIAFAIHVGVATSRKAITLEQYARNQPYNKPDFKDVVPASPKCVEDGPDHIESQVDISSVVRKCGEIYSKTDNKYSGVKVNVSTDAGVYLCEYTYYQSMHRLKVPVVFVHIPPFSEQHPEACIVDVLQNIISIVAEDLNGIHVEPSLLLGSAESDKWVEHFQLGLISDDRKKSTAVAAIQTLIAYIEQSEAETLAELREGIKSVITALTCSMSCKITSVSSGCELFLRFITLKAEYTKDFETCKEQLIATGKIYLDKAMKGRNKIAKRGTPFIRDRATLLTHSFSRVTLEILVAAANEGKRFHVYVTESSPSLSGHAMATQLKNHGIPVTVIPDTAVGYIMEQVDCAIVGAEAIVESGGIINTVGTYQIGVLCKATNTPFYAAGESFKFVRLFPLSQSEMPPNRATGLQGLPDDLQSVVPSMDYTPPALVNLIFTDIGVLTPSAVSDELIKLYC